MLMIILKNSKRTSNALKFQKKYLILKKKNRNKLLVLLYSNIVNFCKSDKIKGIPLSIKFIENLIGVRDKGYVIHHSHIMGEIIGYAHLYCSRKVRENYCKTPVKAYNLFKFEFLLLLKGLRSGVWKTQDINIGGKNPSNINFANIGNQINFFDTIKYFQQSLGPIANSLTDKEKNAIFRECEKFLRNDPKFSKRFLLCMQEEKNGFSIICFREKGQYHMS